MSTAAAAKTEVTKAPQSTTQAGSVELMLKKGTNELVKRTRTFYSVENGQAVLDPDFYEKMLPSHIPMSVVNELDAHNTSLAAATALVHGEAYLDELAKNDKITDFAISYNGGTTEYGHLYKRDTITRNPTTGEKSKRFATVRTTVKTQASKATSGDLSRVKAHISAMGAQLLS